MKDLTDEDLIKGLRETYTKPEIPPCRICGAALTIASCGGGMPTKWVCSEQSLGNGKRMDWKHYGDSEYIDRLQGGDSRVIELIARYEAARPSPDTKEGA